MLRANRIKPQGSTSRKNCRSTPVSFSPRGGLSYEETFPVEAELDLGDATVPMVGEVVISEHDQELARFTGTVSMAGAGYTVEGAFEVTACPDLHRHSI